MFPGLHIGRVALNTPCIWQIHGYRRPGEQRSLLTIRIFLLQRSLLCIGPDVVAISHHMSRRSECLLGPQQKGLAVAVGVCKRI